MKVNKAIAKMLISAGVGDVYTAPPSVTECAEPICVGHADYDRDAKLPGGERGHADAIVYVCRETDKAAENAAYRCERALLSASWERVRDLKGECIVGCDVGTPAFKERDSSGRYVYEIPLKFTIKREQA